MKNYVMALLATAAVGAFASTAQAGVLFHDDFTSNGQVPADNWTGDAFFAPQPLPPTSGFPSVDLVGVGNFASLAPNTGNTTPATAGLIGLNAVDLDGSTGYGNTPLAGLLLYTASLPFGTYTVTFALAGNLRGDVAQTTAYGFAFSPFDTVTLSASQPYTWYTATFTGSGEFGFADYGPSDQQGNLLADVTVSVPEASTWAMMTLGFAGLGFAGYRTSRKAVSMAV